MMKTKERKFLFGIPSWRLSLFAAIFSLVILFIIADLLGSILNIDKNFGEGIAYIIYDILIAAACFFICRNNPKSIWYVPIICNTMGITRKGDRLEEVSQRHSSCSHPLVPIPSAHPRWGLICDAYQGYFLRNR
jgi:hypothetical protein